MDGQPVTYSYVIKELHKTVTFKGLDPALNIGHSFQIGAASIVTNLKKGGRWNLNAIKRYISSRTSPGIYWKLNFLA